MRLTIVAKEKFNLSRRAAKEAIAERKLIVNGKTATKDIDLLENDIVEYLGVVANPVFNYTDYLLKDFNEIKFLYKPPFMHSDRLRPDDELTMSDIVDSLKDFKSISRLDFETDGIIAVVKKYFKIDKVKKEYLAVVTGEFEKDVSVSWSIDAEDRQKVKVNDDYFGYLTEMKLVDSNGRFKLISIKLDTAARHQVRAFCEKLSSPILGDKIYGGEKYQRLMLHCSKYQVNDIIITSEIYGDKFIDEFKKLK